jgi:E3 ubiquitin-protein ligase synoviolin
LREIELERVKEKLSSAIMETCLALTIFREEFNIGFVGMFTVLTFVKVSSGVAVASCHSSH